MKKNRFAIILLLLLALATTALILTKGRKSTVDSPESAFAISDTSTVTKIFLADKNNHAVTLKKLDNGKWSLNDSLTASRNAVEIFLKTITEIDIKSPVPKNARNNIVALLASSSVKVEIYQRVYRIDLFGKIHWWPHEKCTKTYYVGLSTQDNLGTYMLMEGADEPYIVHIPGFNGFLSSRYSPLIKDWRDHGIFNYRYKDLRSVSIEYPATPEASFRITKTGQRTFSLESLQAGRGQFPADANKAMEFFSSFVDIRYEELLNDLPARVRDSITSEQPWQKISITDENGKTFSMKTFRKGAMPGEVDIEGNPVDIDRDRLYALINNEKDFVLIQYYVFLDIFRQLGDFLPVNQQESK